MPLSFCAMTPEQTAPELEIRHLIRKRGKITFADFMRVALYHPDGGYYTKPSAFGASGDY
jgi:SAM-dependent MidA family methyltransferase